MNKSEFVERVAEKAGASKGDAQRFLDAFEETVTETLKSGQEIQITGFGKFNTQKREAREGINPQTKEKIQIGASVTPKFSAGKAFKEAIKG